LRDFLQRESHRPFDLARGPLLRVRLFRCAGEHVLLLVAHHIIVDLSSLAIMLEELSAAWPAVPRGPAPRLAPIERPLADYAARQADLVASESGARQWEYWRRQLDGAPPRLELPGDRPPPPVQKFDGAVRIFEWDDRLAARLRSFARVQHVTL